MSIVLVIIGLIVGGVLVGRDLISIANTRQIISTVEQYKTAIWTYQDKYGWLPGDDPVAYAKFAGGDDTICGANTNHPHTGCNGNGSSAMDQSGADGRRAWKHLELAKMNNFSSSGVPWNNGIVIGGNVPSSKEVKGAGWHFQVTSPVCGRGTGEVPAWLILGGLGNSLSLVAATNGLTNSIAIPIDRKMDDGVAYSGKVCTHWGWSSPSNYPGCLSGTSPYPYNHDSERNCMMMFDIGLP